MSTTKASKKTAPAQAPLASQYRAIGPAAILAALLFRKPATAARSR